MTACALPFFVALALAGLLTPWVRNLALKNGLLDHVRSSRKVHDRPIPRLGGIAMVVAFYAPLLALLWVSGASPAASTARQFVGLLVGGGAVAVVGMVDDVRGLGAVEKFSAQFLIAGLMFGLGIKVETISTPWGAVALGALSLPFTLVWIVGVVNAMNLIDGLDGLASGVALVAVAVNLAVASMSGDAPMVLVMAVLAGAILGFLPFNFYPASIFMGDTGAMFLGFILATTSLLTSSTRHGTVAMLVPVLVLGLPITDTLLALGRRAMHGRPLFAGDRAHVHHKLLAMGLAHRKAVLVLYGVCAGFAGVGLALRFADAREAALILAVTVIVSAVLIRKLGCFSLPSEAEPPAHGWSAPSRRPANVATTTRAMK